MRSPLLGNVHGPRRFGPRRGGCPPSDVPSAIVRGVVGVMEPNIAGDDFPSDVLVRLQEVRASPTGGPVTVNTEPDPDAAVMTRHDTCYVLPAEHEQMCVGSRAS